MAPYGVRPGQLSLNDVTLRYRANTSTSQNRGKLATRGYIFCTLYVIVYFII